MLPSSAVAQAVTVGDEVQCTAVTKILQTPLNGDLTKAIRVLHGIPACDDAAAMNL